MDCRIRIERNKELYGYVRLDDGWISDSWTAEPHWPLRVGRTGRGSWSHYSSTTVIWLWEEGTDGDDHIICDLNNAQHPLEVGDSGPGKLHAARPTQPQYADITWRIVEEL